MKRRKPGPKQYAPTTVQTIPMLISNQIAKLQRIRRAASEISDSIDLALSKLQPLSHHEENASCQTNSELNPPT